MTIHTSDASNTERFRIDSTGTTKIVTGIVTTLTANTTTLNSTTTATGNINVSGANITLQDSGGASDDRLTFGAGTDLSIYHDASHSFIADSGSGDLLLLCSQFKLQNAAGSENMIIATQNAGVQLLYDNSTKLETLTTGLRMQNSSEFTVNGGTIQFGHSSSSDDRLKFGANDTDLQIFHGGNGQFDVNTGDVIIRNTGDFSSSREIYLMARVDEQSVTCYSDGAVELYYDNSKKAETFGSGLKVSGGGELYIDGNAASGHCQLIMTRSDHSWMMTNQTYMRFYTQSGDQSSPNTNVFEIQNNGNLSAAGTLTENSDVSLKENVVTIPNALSKVKRTKSI